MNAPENVSIVGKRILELRYGENPHQTAALYLEPVTTRPCVAGAKQIQGKELSYNNIADADAAFECVAEFTEPAVVIVKHMNPCGVACGATPLEAYTKALACDAVSAFGGIVALNRPLDAILAAELSKFFLEVIIAPSVNADALIVLAAKQNMRVLETGGMPDVSAIETTIRSVSGGFLVQTRDNKVLEGNPTVVTRREPSTAEMADMHFAFTVCKHVKSNAIVYASGGVTLGIGAGQMSRIYSAKIAAMKSVDAGLNLGGAVMASDAFMPFSDCVEEAVRVGATAIIQPGGSKNDQASIAAADAAGIAMVFTGIRHFKH